MESELRQASKMEAVGQLAGGVAHDFNNMLAVILSYADVARAGLDAQDPLRQDLEEILSAARRSADLTQQLLAFSRRQAVVPQVLDLNDAISGQQGMITRLIGEDIALSVSFAPGAEAGAVRRRLRLRAPGAPHGHALLHPHRAQGQGRCGGARRPGHPGLAGLRPGVSFVACRYNPDLARWFERSSRRSTNGFARVRTCRHCRSTTW